LGWRLSHTWCVRSTRPTGGEALIFVTAVSPIIAAFFEELNRSSIRYCHWKSNHRLAESLAGKRDLDLLIDPRNEAAFRALAQRMQLHRLVEGASDCCPGIEDLFV
jgi:hypothetical protein